MLDLENMTYGAELELADIDQKKPLPPGFGWDRRDVSMVNSNGIAVDPRGILYDKGGEINTPPAEDLVQQVEHFLAVKELFPEARVNYRSNLHIHVRIPGLSEDLEALKKLQQHIHTELKPLLAEIEPIPVPAKEQYPGRDEFEGAKWRYRRRKKSHQTFLTPQRVAKQLAAKTIPEFFEAEVPRSKKGEVMWHAQSRCAVNIRQLRETDTIEFRHFPGTLDVEEFHDATLWCAEYLLSVFLTGAPIAEVWKAFRKRHSLPKFEPYIHTLEMGYQLTTADGTVPREERLRNIHNILRENHGSA